MTDTSLPRAATAPSRRALLTAAAGGLGAWMAGAIGRGASIVEAANGDQVFVGQTHAGTATTTFNVPTSGFSALWGNSTATSGVSVGVRGDAASSQSNAAGVLGSCTGGCGVRGSGLLGVRGDGTFRGVFGQSQNGGVEGVGGTGAGVQGKSDSGYGVLGNSLNNVAVYGQHEGNGTGIIGWSHILQDSQALPSQKGATGVYGECKTSSSSRGVWGAAASGQGVRGEAASGIGVYGVATDPAGYGLRSSGRVRFDKISGVASIPAGSTSVTISVGVDVATDSFVLLTSKSNLGTRSLYYSTDATNNRITIRLSASRTSATTIAWLLLR